MMHFRILGSLEAMDGDGPVALGGVRQRATLAYLLLHNGTAVSTSELVAALWAHNAPLTAVKIVQNAVARVRSAFLASEPSQRPSLTSHPGGYLLQVAPRTLDFDRFRILVEAARASRPDRDLTEIHLRAALNLRRGPILADIEEYGMNWPQIGDVRSAYARVRGDWAVTALAQGRHRAVVDALSPDPGDWRGRAALMIALYRGDRQADALAMRRAIRDRAHQPALARVEHAILTHDPALLEADVERTFLTELATAGTRTLRHAG